MTEPTTDECFAAGKGPEQSVPYSEGGLSNTPEERARFEAYMRGHCWEIGNYDESLKAYDTVLVRMLYGVWRDRGALCESKLKSLNAQPVPVEPDTVCWFKHGPYSDSEPLICVFDDPQDDDNYSPLIYRGHYDTLQSALQRAQEEINKNPCCCVPDGDDGTVAHLCKWHQDKFGKAYRMQNMADSVTVENFTKLSPAKLRLFIAHGIQESTARKKAEQENRRMVELMKEPSEAMWSAVWVSIKVPPLQRARSVLSVHDLRLLWAAFHQAMSAELLKEAGE